MPQDQLTDADIAKLEAEGKATLTAPAAPGKVLTDADIAALNAPKTPYNPNAPPDWTPQADPMTRLAEGVGTGVAGIAGGLVGAGKALVDVVRSGGDPNNLHPSTKQAYDDLMNAYDNQWQKVKDAWQRGDYAQSAAHAALGLAGPVGGFAAEHAAETMGGGQTLPTYDKYGNVLTSGTLPDVAGGAGQTAVLAGSVYAPKVISDVVVPKVAGAVRAVPKAAGVLPGAAARAGASLTDVAQAAGNLGVDVSGPGQIALDAVRKAQLTSAPGASMQGVPGIMQGFLNRITNPKLGPLTFQEARDFYTNSHLSVNEMNSLSPTMQRTLAQFRDGLHNALVESADQVGKGAQYDRAIQQYRTAMATQKAVQKLGPVLAKKVLPGLGIAGLEGYVMSKFFGEKAKGGTILDRHPSREAIVGSLR